MAIVAKPIGANTACVSLDEFNNESHKDFINVSMGSFNNSVLSDADPSIVTITENSTDPALTNQINYQASPEYFFHSRSLEVVYNGIQARLKTVSKVSGGNIGATASQVHPKWEFWTDTELLVLNVRQFSEYTLQIDGVYVSKLTTFVGNYGSNNVDIKLEFADRRKRRVTLNFNENASGFAGVKIRPTDTIWPVEASIKSCFMGDSFASGIQPNIPSFSYATQMMQALNIDDYMINSDGGTGFVNNQSGTKLNYLERVSDVTDIDFDLIFVSLSENDSSSSDMDIQSSINQWHSSVRAENKTAIIVVCGIPSSFSAADQAKEQVGFDAFSALNDPNLLMIPTMTSDLPPITGTGRDSAPTVDGNADNYISSDGTHFNQAGHEYYGFWLAQKVFNLLKS